jgi:YVTN family beta-propeller protein
VSLPDFRSVGVVQGLKSPRYFLPVSATRGYVTQWGNFGSVRPGIKIIDLSTYAVVDSIATGSQPERLVLAGGRVYVANVGSNSLTVIDPATHRVTSTLVVGDAPNSLATDKNGLLWVSCGGMVAYTPSYDIDYAATTPGKLVSINPTAATVVSTRTFASNRLQPTDLHLNGAGDQLYFRAADASSYVGPVFRLGIADASLPVFTAPFIRRNFYGLNVDPRTDVIYGGTGTFQGTDKLIRYQSTGAPLDSATVGIGPNGFVFY